MTKKKYSSIADALIKHRNDAPDKFCVIDLSGEYTYEDIYSMMLSAVIGLYDEGMCCGDRIICKCTQNAEYIACCLACQYMGVIFVPVENGANTKRIQTIYDETQAKLIISNENTSVPGKHITWSSLFSSAVDNETADLPERNDNPDTYAEILYTTGTTGTPKGIVMTNLANVSVAENIVFGTFMQADNIELIPLPLSHSHGIRTCYANILNGSTVALINGISDGRMFADMVGKYNITSFDLSPTAARILLKTSKKKLEPYISQIDYLEVGTEAMDEKIKNSLCEFFTESRLYNFYGSTESGRCCILEFSRVKDKKGCIGKPSINADIIIVNDAGVEIESAENNTGLIAISGTMNMTGYYNDIDATKSTLQNGYVYTNDIGYIDKTGEVYLIGRKGSIINYKGIKIAPEEIEAIVCEHKDIQDCACVPHYDKLGGQVPKLYISLKGNTDIDKAQFNAFLRGALEQNKIPPIIEVVDSIPRASNGKILRNLLM